MTTEHDALFDRVVELCGFSAYVGPGAVRRSLAEAGCDGAATPDDYRNALPALQRRLQVYVPEEEAAARIERIRAFLDEADKAPVRATPNHGFSDDETKWGKRRFGKSVAILQQARAGLDPSDDES